MSREAVARLRAGMRGDIVVDPTARLRARLRAKPEPIGKLPEDGTRLIGEWARIKGHCKVEFLRARAGRTQQRGDFLRGVDVDVIRVHKGGRWLDDDLRVTEAEYDAAVTEAYGLPLGSFERGPHAPAPPAPPEEPTPAPAALQALPAVLQPKPDEPERKPETPELVETDIKTPEESER